MTTNEAHPISDIHTSFRSSRTPLEGCGEQSPAYNRWHTIGVGRQDSRQRLLCFCFALRLTSKDPSSTPSATASPCCKGDGAQYDVLPWYTARPLSSPGVDSAQPTRQPLHHSVEVVVLIQVAGRKRGERGREGGKEGGRGCEHNTGFKPTFPGPMRACFFLFFCFACARVCAREAGPCARSNHGQREYSTPTRAETQTPLYES